MSHSYKKLKQVMKQAFKDTSALETIIVLLLLVGLPSISYIYLDVKAAYTTFILVAITLGIMKLRNG